MKKTYKMIDLECANCAAKMEREISELKGVEKVSISFLLQKMIIETDDSLHEEIMEQAAKICKKIEPDCKIKL